MRPRQLTESPPRFPVSNVGSGKHLLAAMQSGTLQGCCSEVWPDNVDISKRKFSWEFKTESKREQIRTFWYLMGKSHSHFLETHSFSFQSTHTRGWKKKKQTNQNYPQALCKILVTTSRKNTSSLRCSALCCTSAPSARIHRCHCRVCSEAIQSPDFCFKAKITQKGRFFKKRSSMARRYAPRAHCCIGSAQPRWVQGCSVRVLQSDTASHDILWQHDMLTGLRLVLINSNPADCRTETFHKAKHPTAQRKGTDL